MDKDQNQETNKAEIKKENLDFPNISASTDKVNATEKMEKEIKKTSKLNPEGKTDNTDHNSEN